MAEVAPWLTAQNDIPSQQVPPPATEEKPPVAPWLKLPEPDTGPMPGPIDALTAGLKRSFSDISQSGEALEGKKPTQVAPDTSPAAAPFTWSDVLQPSHGLSKLAYQTGESSPTLAGGILGGVAGSMVEPGLGTAIGGIGGSAAGAALQTIGPAFDQELKKHPDDPDGAWDRAVESSVASGAFSGAAWAAYPLRFFKGQIKNLAFQAFGIQPGINIAQKATQNVITGEPVTEGLGQAYAQGAVGTAVPAVGHLALRGRFGEPVTTPEQPTPQQSNDIANTLMTQAQQHINTAAVTTQPNIAQKLLGKAADLQEAASWELDRHAAPQRVVAQLAQADQLERQAKTPNLPLTQVYDLRAQASALIDSARQDSFIANLPPPIPEKTGLLGRFKQSYLDNVDPASASEAALKADAVMAMYNSKKGQLKDSLLRLGNETYRSKWTTVPWDDQKRFLSAYETGQPVPTDLAQKYPWSVQAGPDYRRALQTSYENEIAMGSKAHYLENYMPHMWEQQDAAKNLFTPDNLVSSMGDTWFQHARDYEMLELGEAHGLVPKYKNVQDMVTNRLLSGADMVNKMEMLHELQKIGVATPVGEAPAQVRNPKIVGSPYPWEPVNAPDRQQWLIAPDAQMLWKNGVEAKGLWEDPTALGDAFRGWMKLKSAWVPVKLGLSMFHPVHVAHINAVNNMSRALGETFGSGQQGIGRRFAAMPEALLQSVADPFFRALPYVPFVGKRMMKSWGAVKDFQSPQQMVDNRLMNEAGVSAQLSEQLRMKAVEGLRDAWANNKYLQVLPRSVLVGYEKSLGSIFEKWIPSLKMAALQREADTLFRRRPDLVNDETNRRVALRALGKQIDSRFGEMFYGSLFWNRTLKDASIGSFLSLGWNLGFAREFGGGTFEPIVRRMIDAPNPTRKLVRDTTNKTTNMFLYGLTAATINGIMNKTMSGDNPEGLDYIFPRIGGLNPDGSPRRITNAFYTREVPMAIKNIEERQSVAGGLSQMLYHKMMFSPFEEMYNNKDYYGYSIRDENSPAYQQLWQMGKHLVGDQLSPMSVSGAKRALDLSGKPHTTADVLKQLTDRDVYMPLLGFGPAPAYASKSALQNRIQFLFKEQVAPERKSFDVSAMSQKRSEARTAYMGALQRGDRPAQIEAARTLASLGVSTSQIANIQPGGVTQYMFQRLQAPDQRALLTQMSPEDFKTYYPKSNKKMRQSDAGLAALARRYYGTSPP
jgi:hypothetical protein